MSGAVWTLRPWPFALRFEFLTAVDHSPDHDLQRLVEEGRDLALRLHEVAAEGSRALRVAYVELGDPSLFNRTGREFERVARFRHAAHRQ